MHRCCTWSDGSRAAGESVQTSIGARRTLVDDRSRLRSRSRRAAAAPSQSNRSRAAQSQSDPTSRLTSARAGAPSRRRTRQPRHHHVPGGTGRDCVAAYLAVRQRDGLEMDRAYRVSAKRRTTTRPGRQRITHPDPPFPAPTRMRKATRWRACAWMACRDAARIEGEGRLCVDPIGGELSRARHTASEGLASAARGEGESRQLGMQQGAGCPRAALPARQRLLVTARTESERTRATRACDRIRGEDERSQSSRVPRRAAQQP